MTDYSVPVPAFGRMDAVLAFATEGVPMPSSRVGLFNESSGITNVAGNFDYAAVQIAGMKM